jgi:iron(III) transport system substrate-binding protein
MLRLLPLLALVLTGCRIERVAPNANGAGAASCDPKPSGEIWVYTSIYRNVLDKLDPLIAERLPGVKVNWFQAGAEKLLTRIEAELASGGTQADVMAASDPFLYERFKQEKLLAPYVSVHALKIPRELVDAEAYYTTARVGTMVMVHRAELANPPARFSDLSNERYRGRVAIGDALSSGTAATWALFMARTYGDGYFAGLRGNRAIVAGGNAAVLSKVESGEADIGVLLLENALVARGNGSRIVIKYPEDGAVVIPGYVATFASSKNPVAAKAFIDLVLSREGQRAIVEIGDMNAADPTLPGPRGERNLPDLLATGMPWKPALLQEGVEQMPHVKAAFSEAFSK